MGSARGRADRALACHPRWGEVPGAVCVPPPPSLPSHTARPLPLPGGPEAPSLASEFESAVRQGQRFFEELPESRCFCGDVSPAGCPPGLAETSAVGGGRGRHPGPWPRTRCLPARPFPFEAAIKSGIQFVTAGDKPDVTIIGRGRGRLPGSSQVPTAGPSPTGSGEAGCLCSRGTPLLLPSFTEV